MDVERMLQKCHAQQWRLDDLDWSAQPRAMRLEEELRIVQFFTDMASIELMAAALFAHQARVAPQPTLRHIFATFVEDERRHADVALRLARHYDVHQLRSYAPQPELTLFGERFLRVVEHLPTSVATAFITAGEILLDVALLRSLNDYVRDDTCRRAMRLIDRDEARHIAMDYYMVEFYAKLAAEGAEAPVRQPLPERLRAGSAFVGVLTSFAAALKKVYLEPMETMNPEGDRIREAAKRIQLLRCRSGIADLPIAKVMSRLDAINRHPLFDFLSGGIARQLSGALPTDLLQQLFSPQELARANAMPIDAMAEETLALGRAGAEHAS
jgi:hypothetical protein